MLSHVSVCFKVIPFIFDLNLEMMAWFSKISGKAYKVANSLSHMCI